MIVDGMMMMMMMMMMMDVIVIVTNLKNKTIIIENMTFFDKISNF